MYIAFLKRESNKCTKNITAEYANLFGDKTSKVKTPFWSLHFEVTVNLVLTFW